MVRYSFTITAAILLLACAGCTNTDEPRTEPDAAAERIAPGPSSTLPAELTSDNLDAYERGMKKEIEAVRAAQQLSGTAKTAQERGQAMQASFAHATIPQGAAAAGLS